LHLSRSVSCSLTEGTLAEDLGALHALERSRIGSYPTSGAAIFGVTLVIRGTDRARLADATEELMVLIRGLGDIRKRD
jgi:hypothetical protein